MHNLVKLRAIHLGHRFEPLTDRAPFGAFCSVSLRDEPWDIEQTKHILEYLPDFDVEFLDNQGSSEYERLWIWIQLGEANSKLGRYRESEKMYTRAIQLSRQMQGPYHHDTLGIMWRWYKVSSSEGRRSEMIEVLEFLLGAYTMIRKVALLDTIIIRTELALVYWEQRRHREAMMLQTETVTELKFLFGMDHYRTHSAMSLWGKFWTGNSRLQDVAVLRLPKDEAKDRTELFELWAVGTIEEITIVQI